MMGPIAYLGGKRRLAPQLIALFPEHTTYVEPFAGGAQVFFHKEASPVEVLNDLDGEVVNFFRVCQFHHDELIRYLRFVVVSRSLFTLYKAQNSASLTDIQRAARFLYLQKNSFGGKIEGRGQNYHACVIKNPNYNVERLPELLEATARRLARTQLECLPYERILSIYDRPTTLFYLDPPYVGVDFYKHNLPDEAFAQMADRLAGIQGKFVLSINDHPVAHEAFERFHRFEVRLSYTLSRKVPTHKELVFTNFSVPDIAEASQLLDSRAA